MFRIKAGQGPVRNKIVEDGCDGSGVREPKSLPGLDTAIVTCFKRRCEDVR